MKFFSVRGRDLAWPAANQRRARKIIRRQGARESFIGGARETVRWRRARETARWSGARANPLAGGARAKRAGGARTKLLAGGARVQPLVGGARAKPLAVVACRHLTSSAWPATIMNNLF